MLASANVREMGALHKAVCVPLAGLPENGFARIGRTVVTSMYPQGVSLQQPLCPVQHKKLVIAQVELNKQVARQQAADAERTRISTAQSNVSGCDNSLQG